MGLRYGPGMNTENHNGPAETGQKDETHFGFQTVEREQKSGMVRSVFNGVADQYDLMNDLMSVGVHRLWKTAMIDWLNPRPGWRLLDVAGGTGDIAERFLARADERSRDGDTSAIATVCDINEAMVGVGRDRALDRGALERITRIRSSVFAWRHWAQFDGQSPLHTEPSGIWLPYSGLFLESVRSRCG